MLVLVLLNYINHLNKEQLLVWLTCGLFREGKGLDGGWGFVCGGEEEEDFCF